MGDDELIRQYITAIPHFQTDARLRPYGMHVWAIIGQLRVSDGDRAAVAEYYRIPLEAVEAALAYYGRHKEYIDARLLLNSA